MRSGKGGNCIRNNNLQFNGEETFSYFCGSGRGLKLKLQQKCRSQWRQQMLTQSVHHECYANLDHMHLKGRKLH